MLLPRTKLIEEFRELLIANDHQYIVLVAPSGGGKTTFLSLLSEAGIIDASQTVYATTLDISTFSIQKPKTIIFDGDIVPDISYIRTFIESELIDSKVIYTTETLGSESDVSYFQIPWISFREYSEGYGVPVEIGSILGEIADLSELNSLRDDYIHLGQYGKNISDPENLEDIWNANIAIMVQELFEKETNDFIEYIRTLALGVGDLFKEDRIAKMMNISRRKVRKYTELLMKHGFIRAIGPFGDSPDTELFRHVKIYFCDLSFLAIALGVGYYHGPSKQGVIENFIFLELDRKLSRSHDIRFYRKKSGAEVSFVLVDQQSGLITPIDISIRPTDIIPQALRLFAETYSSRIERIMFMNEERAGQKELSGKTLIILPHVAI